MDKKIIMLIEDHAYARMVYNNLKNDFRIDHIIIDNGQSYSKQLKSRIKRLGIIHVIGQLLFRIVVIPFLNYSAKDRIINLLHNNGFKDTTIEKEISTAVTSINSKEGHDLLLKLNPDIVIVICRRIISKKTLELTNGKFINLHGGITPIYRGMHGAYWALVNSDKEHCGVTVHLIDEGIDTGGILYQDTITPMLNSGDNYISYTYLQLVKILPILKKAINDIQTNSIKIKNPGYEKGKMLYFQPTIWYYLYHRWIKKIK